MIRRRGHGPEGDASSSDDEEDAFSALSKKVHAKKKAKSAPLTCDATTKRNREEKIRESNVTAAESSVVESKSGVREFSSCDRPQMTVTSSIKRHHKPNDTRKAKMDALLQELEAKKNELPKTTKRFVPEKKGSFVVPGEEHLTSNLFVGNLAPSIAEEVNSLYGIKFLGVLFPFSNSNFEFVDFLSRILATSFRSLVRCI